MSEPPIRNAAKATALTSRLVVPKPELRPRREVRVVFEAGEDWWPCRALGWTETEPRIVQVQAEIHGAHRIFMVGIEDIRKPADLAPDEV